MATLSRGLKMLRLMVAGLMLLAAGTLHVAVAAEGDPGDEVPGRFQEYDLLMKVRPDLALIAGDEEKFPVGLKVLWLRALKRPDPELQRLVIDTMAMAYEENLQGLEIALGELTKLASADDQDLDVLRATVQTLILLDPREHEELFAKLAVVKGRAISEIVEPALTAWGSTVMQQDWVERVEEQSASASQMILAMKGIAAIKATKPKNALQRLTRNASALRQLRITAARTLGKVDPSGQVQLATDILAEKSRPQALNALLALAAIESDDSENSIAVLNGLVNNDNSAVQSEALRHLYRIDYQLVEPFVDQLIGSRDVNVRWWCAKSMVDGLDSKRIAMLASLLDDLNPTLRRFAGSSLVQFSDSADLKPIVIKEVQNVLAKNGWRGCEQACVVLAKLDHDPSAQRMVELLGHPRGDVQVAAAWGLTQLRVAEVLPDMLDHAESIYQGLSSKQLNARMPGVTLHLAHLYLAFGDQAYTPSEPLLRKMIEKSYEYGEFARPAAIWALGMFHEGDADSDLVPLLTERLLDEEVEFPEMFFVRVMSAVSLGRMKATTVVDEIQGYVELGDLVGSAARWSVEQITGTPVPVPSMRRTTNTKDHWFLTPLPADPR